MRSSLIPLDDYWRYPRHAVATSAGDAVWNKTVDAKRRRSKQPRLILEQDPVMSSAARRDAEVAARRLDRVVRPMQPE